MQHLVGSVSDMSTNEGLIGATVKVLDREKVSVTDQNGHFALHIQCDSVYTVQVSYIGYETSIAVINPNQKKEISIALKPSARLLNEASVMAIRELNTPLMQQSRFELRDLELTRGLSLGDALRSIPGLTTLETGPSISKPVIHGMHSNRVLIYNAGVRQEGQQWGSEHAPEVDPFIASSVTVVKGAASVMYGADAMGGVILVEPAPLRYTPGIGGKIETALGSSNGMLAQALTLEGATNNSLFAYRVQVSSRLAANARTPNYYLKNTGFRELNGAAILGFAKNRFAAEVYASTFNSKLGIFQGAHIGNTTDLIESIAREEPLIKGRFSYEIGRPYQLINHNILKLTSSYNLNEVGRLHLQYSYQQNNREEYDVVRQAYENTYQLKFDLSTQALDLHLDHNPIWGIKGKIGVAGQFQQNFFDGRYLIPFFRAHTMGAYIIERWSRGPFEIEGGLRYDNRYMRARLREEPTVQNSPEIRPEFYFKQFTGTLGANYKLTPDWQLHASAARGWRPPSINELFSQGVHHGSARYELGDRNLKEEASINLNLGIKKTGERLSGEINVFHNTIDNYIYLKPGTEATLTVRGAFLKYNYVQVNGEMYGADAVTNYIVNPYLTITAKYSTVRAYDRETGSHLEFIPPDGFTGILSFTLPERPRFAENIISLGTHYTARQWRVRDNQDFAPTPPAYTLFNLNMSTRMQMGKHHATLSLSVYNMLNTRYRNYMNAFRYFSDEVGRNIMLRVAIPFGVQ